ncbi:MAG: hypothetical protein AAGF60_10440 [Pseudomonadota bacterium]
MTDHPNSAGAPVGTDDLAARVISVLRDRQATAPDGARRLVLDHLVRVICKDGAFDARAALDILRGYRIPLDMVIGLYIPRAAERLGEMWMDDEADFATVTIATMRLQALLEEASGQVFDRPNAVGRIRALVVIPAGEQHFLGASVLAAQLRRLGCETQMSFAEEPGTIRQRALFDRPDALLFTCARAAGLEPIGQIVLGIRNAMSDAPVMAVGGAVRAARDVVMEMTGADIVTTEAKDVIAFCAQRRRAVTGG